MLQQEQALERLSGSQAEAQAWKGLSCQVLHSTVLWVGEKEAWEEGASTKRGSSTIQSLGYLLIRGVGKHPARQSQTLTAKAEGWGFSVTAMNQADKSRKNQNVPQSCLSTFSW